MGDSLDRPQLEHAVAKPTFATIIGARLSPRSISILQRCGGRRCASVGHPQESTLLLIWWRDFVPAEDSWRSEYSCIAASANCPAGAKDPAKAQKVGFSAVANNIRGSHFSKNKKRTARKLPSEYGYIKHWNALMKKSGYGSGLMMGG